MSSAKILSRTRRFQSLRRATLRRLLAVTGSAVPVAACLAAMTLGGSAPRAANAADHTWIGTATGNFSTASNWSPAAFTAGDNYIFTNTLTTSLTPTLLAAINPGGAGINFIDNKTNNPVTLDVDASLSQASLAGNGASVFLRLNNITVAAGATFTLGGSGANAFQIVPGSAGATQVYTNNSTNTFTIGRDVVWRMGGGGAHNQQFAGPGNFAMLGNINSNNGANETFIMSSTGTLTLSGNSDLNNDPFTTATHNNSSVIEGQAGTINITGNLGDNPIQMTASANTVAVINASGNVTRTGGTITDIGTNVNANGLNRAGGGTSVLNITAGTWSGGTGRIAAGVTGTGVINVSGTASVTPGQFVVAGITNSGAAGIWNVTGGTIATSGNNGGTLGASTGTTGVFNITSGSYTSTDATANGAAGMYVGESGTGTLNISGTGQMALGGVSTSAGLTIARNNGAVGVVNLGAIGSGGGTINTVRVQQTASSGTSIFNFHGGVLQASSAANSTFMNGLTSAYVYGEGGTIDNNGQSITIGQSLLNPGASGAQGVTSITLGGTTTGFTPGATPLVTITGGGGTGATAKALVDNSGNLSVVITNPGTGYTSAPTVNFSGTAGLTPTGTASLAANSSGGLSILGGGTTVLGGTNTYTGNTTVTANTTLAVTGSLAGNVNVTSGKLDGTGTVGNVTIANSATNAIANGNGVSGSLTVSTLAFAGAAAVNSRSISLSPAIIVTGALSTTPANGTVTINPTASSGAWTTGMNNLISFGSFSGSLGNFTLGTITGTFNSRQTNGGLVLNGNNIALNVIGDSPKWTGLDSGLWQTGSTGSNDNWKLVTAGTKTDFIAGDITLFDDSATSATTLSGSTVTVNINAANVGPTSATFNNSALNYTLNSTGSFGIADGSVAAQLVKSGSGTLTINTNNTFTGGTTLQGGVLILGAAGALGNGALTISTGTAKTIDASSALTLTGLTAQNWNDSFTFTGSNSLDMGSGNVTLGGTSGTRTVTLSANALTVGKIVDSGTHGLSVTGGGTLIVTGAGGGNASSVINGTLNVDSGTTLQINRTGDASGGDFTAAGLTGNGTISNGASVTRWLFVTNPTNTTFNGALVDGGAGTLGLRKDGAGTLTVAGTSSYTGLTTMNGGILAITGTNTGAGTNVNFTGPSTLVIGNASALGTTSDINLNATNGAAVSFATDGVDNLAYTLRGNTGMNVTFISDRATPGSGTNHTFTTQGDGISGFGGGTFNFTSGANNPGGSMTINLFGMSAGSVQNYILNPTTANAIIGDVRKVVNTPNGTLVLDGTSTGNQVTGVISNGLATISLTKSNTSTWTLTNNNTYTGTTTISGGTLVVGNGGTVGSLGTGAITNNGTLNYNLDSTQTITIGSIAGTTAGTIGNIGGAKLVFTGTTANAVVDTLGTIDGTGSVGATTIANNMANVIQNGNGTSTPLTVSALTFGGTATANLNVATKAIIVTGALATTPANGQVTINVTPASGTWVSGLNNLIGFGSFSGSVSNFTLGAVGGTFGVRQSVGGLALNGNNLALLINGDTPRWTGAVNPTWSTANISNWQLVIAGTPTNFITSDSVIFDDNATLTTADINAANVNPVAVTFQNVTKNFVINGTGGFGIASGSINMSGSGTTTVNSVNTSTGNATVNQGKLVLTNSNAWGTAAVNALGTLTADFSAGNVSTNILGAGTGISMQGGTFNVVGHATNATSETPGSFTLNPGASTVSATNNGADVLVALNTITHNVGGVASFKLSTGAQTGTNGITTSNSTDGSAGGGLLGPWAVVNNAGVYTYATLSGTNVAAYTTATTNANMNWGAPGNTTDNWDITGNVNSNAGISRQANTVRYTGTGYTLTNGGAIYTLNGLMNSGSGTFTVSPNIAIGANNELVAIAATSPVVLGAINNGSGAGALTTVGFAQPGPGNNYYSVTLTGTSGFTGPMTVAGGTTVLSGTAAVNTSSGITINGPGAKLVQTSSVAVTPTITVNSGTLDGIGAVGAVTVANGLGGVITNGNGATGALTIGSLTFLGSGSITAIPSGGSAGVAVTGQLSTSPVNGKVTVNSSGTFTLGMNNLVSYGILNASIGDFTVGTISGISARGTYALALNGSNLALNVTSLGQAVVWSGAAGPDGTWSTSTTGSNAGTNHWALATGHTPTNFWALDDVQFNDTVNLGAGPVAPTTTAVSVSGSVVPSSVTFNNSALNYTLSTGSSSGIGGSSTVTKNGTGIATLNTVNTYTGATTVNAGTLTIGSTGSLNGSAITVNGGTMNGDGSISTSNITVAAGATFTQGVTGSISNSPTITVSGTASLNGTANALGGVRVTGAGNMTINANATANSISNAGLSVGDTPGDNAILSITGGNVIAARGTGNPSVQVGATASGSGTLNMSGGTLDVGTAEFWIGAAAAGTGTVNLSGGTITSGSWVAVGRGATNPADAVLSISGGTLFVNTRNSGQNFTIASFAGGGGTTNVSAGTLSSGTNVWVGEGGTGIMSVTGTGSVVTNTGAGSAAIATTSEGLVVARNTGAVGTLNVSGGGTVTINPSTNNGGNSTLMIAGNATGATGTVNLGNGSIGGTITTPSVRSLVTSGGTSTLNFNGGALAANADATDFIQGVNQINVRNAGAGIDTNGHTVAVNVDLPHSTIGGDNAIDGGLTKAGAGTLTVNFDNTYTGPTAVNGGTLAFNVSQANRGNITVASGATGGIVAAGDTTGTINPQPALVNGAGDPSGYVPGDKYVIANNVTVAAGGKFDVNDGILVINNGTFSAVNAAVHAGRIFSSTSQYDANNLLGLTGLGMGDNFDLSYAGIGANNQLTITGSLIPAASDFGQQFIFKYTYIGDANLDGKVTTSDYDFVFGNLGSTTNGVTGNPVIWGDGDFNGNGVVDTTDLDNLFANLGFGTTGNVQPPLLPGTSVPEPSSVALLLLGLAGSAAVIRRKK